MLSATEKMDERDRLIETQKADLEWAYKHAYRLRLLGEKMGQRHEEHSFEWAERCIREQAARIAELERMVKEAGANMPAINQ